MGQITKVLLLAFAIVLMAEPACAARITIRSCYDGDTCRTTDGERIRLACIDAPEMKPKPCFRATSMQAFAYDNTAAADLSPVAGTVLKGLCLSCPLHVVQLGRVMCN